MLNVDAATLMAATSNTSDAISKAFWDVAAGITQLVAVVRTVRMPAERWAHGRWSKAAAIVATLWLTTSLGIFVLPVGAGFVIWHTRTLAHRAETEPTAPDLPFAEGTPEPAEEDAR